MHQTTAPRLAMAAAVLLLLSGLCLAGSKAPAGAAYVEGTITDVPFLSTGNLDLSSNEKFSFRSGKASYDIRYADIVDVRLGRKRDGLGAQLAAGAATVGRTVLPVFFPDNKYITVDFRHPSNTNTERMIFQIPEDVAQTVLPVLESRAILAKPEKQQAVKPPHNDDSWWGNGCWRTNRNQHLWPSPASNGISTAKR
jgi:hypothetical protein